MRRLGARMMRAMRAMMTCGGALGLVALAAPGDARADTPRVHELRYDLPADLSVIGGSLALLIASEYLIPIKPRDCRWCARAPGDTPDADPIDTLNGLDRWARDSFKAQDPVTAQTVSNVTAYLGGPVIAAIDIVAASAADKAARAVPKDALVISEAVLVSMVLNQTAKVTFARERPFVHALNKEGRSTTDRPWDNNVSFYSGHTSATFAIAAAAGTVATLRGYRLMPLVWSTLMPLAAVTGFLRIAGDRHYFTDVLVGAVFGSAVGVLMPVVFHGRQGSNLVPTETLKGGDTVVMPGSSTASMRLPSLVTLGGGF